jgi:hypothetical protein
MLLASCDVASKQSVFLVFRRNKKALIFLEDVSCVLQAHYRVYVCFSPANCAYVYDCTHMHMLTKIHMVILILFTGEMSQQPSSC